MQTMTIIPLTITAQQLMNDTDSTIRIITTIGGFIAALGGFEFIKWLFNRHNNNRMEAAKAFEVEYKAIMADYKRVQEEVDANKKQIDELNKKIDALYEKVHQLEGDKLQLIQENNTLKLQLKEAEKHVCLRPNDNCFQRLNPNDECRLRKLVRGDYAKAFPDAIITEEDIKKNNNNNETKED